MLVTPVVGKDRDRAMIMQPLVVSRGIVTRIPQVGLPGAHRHGEFAAMGDKLGTLCGIAGVGRAAQGQFQAQLRVEVGGGEA